MLKKILRKKIMIEYRTFFMSMILLFGFLSFFKPLFLDVTMKISTGNIFSIGMFIIFVILFLMIDEQKKIKNNE